MRRKLDTEESRKFWRFVEETARKVRQWPEWKRRNPYDLAEMRKHAPSAKRRKEVADR